MTIMKIKVTVLTSLYRCEMFLENYFYHISRLEHTDEIEILLLHNDPIISEINIINQNINNYPFVKYHVSVCNLFPLHSQSVCFGLWTVYGVIS